MEAEPDEVRSGTPFVTVVEIPAAVGPGLSLAELVEPAPGVRVRRQAGPGSAATVSVRGSTPAQVQVFLDGVPLDRAAFDVVDLSDLPLGSLARVEVHRGGVPPSLGSGAVGGALHLRTRPPSAEPAHELSAGVGSFATRSLDAARSARLLGVGYRLSLHYRGTEGDFPYFDDGGTELNRSDDSTRLRGNNDSNAAAALLRAGRAEQGGKAWGVLGLVSARRRGAPGAYHGESASSRAEVLRGLVDAHISLPAFERAELTFGLHGTALAERLLVVEPRRGLGMLDTDDRTWQAGLRAGLVAGVGMHHRVELSATGRWEGFVPVDRGGAAGPAQHRGLAAFSVSDEVFLLGDRLVIRAAVRSDLVLSRRATADDSTGPRGEPPLDSGLMSPRLGARLGLVGGLSLKTNVGLFHRLPAFYELFGRRDHLAASPDLRPERARNADLGLVFERPAWGPLRKLALEASLFVSDIDDVVVFVPNSQSTLVGRNLAEATRRGLEIEATARLPVVRLELAGSYTLLDARNRSGAPSEDGRRLPGRPLHDASARATWALGPVEVAYRLGWLAGAYYDTPNFRPIPDRLEHGVSLGWRPLTGWQLGIQVDNLLDQRVAEVERRPGSPPARVLVPVADFAGWPLPGRAVYASVRWSDG